MQVTGQCRLLKNLLVILSTVQISLLLVQYIVEIETLNFILFSNTYAILIIAMLYIACAGLAENFLLFSFYGCFFIFLMGQKLFFDQYNEFRTFALCILKGRDYTTFSAIISTALIATFFSYFYFAKRKSIAKEKTSKIRPSLLPIARVGFWISCPFAFYMQFKVVLTKRAAESYEASYLSNVDMAVIVKVFNYLFLFFALLYLAHKPPKKQMFAVLAILFIVQGGIQILQGRRALFAITLFFSVWYILKYFDVKKFKTTTLLLLGSGVVALIVLFYIIEKVRGGSSADGGMLAIIKNFLISTGGSDSVIANTIRLKEEFPKPGVAYLFNPIIEIFINNPIVNNLLGRTTEVAQGIEYLQTHNDFSHWISYLTMPDFYLMGRGMGSSYLAEVYLAFGVIGVAVVSVLLGRCLVAVSNMNLGENAVLKNTILLFFCQYTFTLPRSGLFSWFNNFFYLLFGIILVLPFYFSTNFKLRSSGID